MKLNYSFLLCTNSNDFVATTRTCSLTYRIVVLLGEPILLEMDLNINCMQR